MFPICFTLTDLMTFMLFLDLPQDSWLSSLPSVETSSVLMDEVMSRRMCGCKDLLEATETGEGKEPPAWGDVIIQV